MLGEIVTSCYNKAKEQQAKEGYIKLERGFATIPLPGIDVPFHSRYLWAGVMPFRACELSGNRHHTIFYANKPCRPLEEDQPRALEP